MSSSHGSNGATTTAGVQHTLHHTLHHYTPEQRKLMQQDAADRDRQARALAAAGMAASKVGGGLKPPPTLGNPANRQNNNGNDPCMQFGSDDQDEPLTLEEMEMDFAKLFDPNVEWANMQTEGSGWPMMQGDGGGGGSGGDGAAAEAGTSSSVGGGKPSAVTSDGNLKSG